MTVPYRPIGYPSNGIALDGHFDLRTANVAGLDTRYIRMLFITRIFVQLL